MILIASAASYFAFMYLNIQHMIPLETYWRAYKFWTLNTERSAKYGFWVYRSLQDSNRRADSLQQFCLHFYTSGKEW